MALFSPSYSNPADDAMPYLEQIPGTVTPLYQPYIDRGNQAGNILSSVYGYAALDPNSAYNRMMAGYTVSPSYQYQQEQLQKTMEGNAAAGGYSGTAYDYQTQADLNQQLLSRDQQQYFQNQLALEQAALSGEQGLYGVGYGASTNLADDLASNLAQEANLAFQGTMYDDYMNQAKRNAWLNTLGTVGGIGAGIALKDKI